MPFLTNTLIQIAVEGHVTSSSGVNRKICNVFCYRLKIGVGYHAGSKASMAAAFDSAVWANIAFNNLPGYVGDQYLVWMPCIPGDTPTASGTPTSYGLAATRRQLDVCAFLYFKTADRGRNWQGSKRFGPIPWIGIDKDQMNGAEHANWQAIANGLLGSISVTTPFGGDVMNPVIWSRQVAISNPPPLSQYVSTPIKATANYTFGTWRHRRERTNR